MNKALDNIKILIAICAVLAGVQGYVYAQNTPPPRVPRPPVARPEPAAKPAPPAIVSAADYAPLGDGDYERAITVDPKVSVTLCVVTGSVKINGSAGDELRVFVRGGSNINFNIREKDPETDKPKWIALAAAAPDLPKGPKGPKGPKNLPTQPQVVSDCIWGNEIEIDVPSGAAVTLKGRRITADIDSLRKASVNTAGGNISLSNITESVEASTYEGSVTVRESRGPMKLDTTTGNIIVFGVNPGESGDVMRAKTSGGNIFLQMIGHRQVEANSISGGVTFAGKLLSGGLYNFTTSNGVLTLNLPVDSSARVNASYGFGNCNVEIPMADVVQTTVGGIKNMTGLLGSGEATLKLTTTSGSIRLRKSDKK